MDLRFLVDRERAILLRNEVMDELDSWNGMLSAEEENQYHMIIQTLNKIINDMPINNIIH